MSDEQHRVESLPEAVVAVITKERKVLLIQRGPDVPGAGYWAPLSGKIHLRMIPKLVLKACDSDSREDRCP
jgi:hypothetical protein